MFEMLCPKGVFKCARTSTFRYCFEVYPYSRMFRKSLSSFIFSHVTQSDSVFVFLCAQNFEWILTLFFSTLALHSADNRVDILPALANDMRERRPHHRLVLWRGISFLGKNTFTRQRRVRKFWYFWRKSLTFWLNFCRNLLEFVVWKYRHDITKYQRYLNSFDPIRVHVLKINI